MLNLATGAVVRAVGDATVPPYALNSIPAFPVEGVNPQKNTPLPPAALRTQVNNNPPPPTVDASLICAIVVPAELIPRNHILSAPDFAFA